MSRFETISISEALTSGFSFNSNLTYAVIFFLENRFSFLFFKLSRRFFNSSSEISGAENISSTSSILLVYLSFSEILH